MLTESVSCPCSELERTATDNLSYGRDGEVKGTDKILKDS